MSDVTYATRDSARNPAQDHDRQVRRPSSGSSFPDAGGADMQVSSWQPGEFGELLRHLGSWPYLRIELRGDRRALRVRDLLIGMLNMQTRAVTINVPPDMVSRLLQVHPQLRRTNDGVTVHVTDVDSRRAAEALMRWRIELERFAGQLRNASP